MADIMTEAGVTLTAKEITFCEQYVIDWNATRAAKYAGYAATSAHNTGKEVLKKDHVKTYIKWLKARTEELAGISALKNAKILRAIAYSKATTTKDRIKAIETLNQMFSFNGPKKVEHSGYIGNQDFENMSDEELADAYQKLQQRRLAASPG